MATRAMKPNAALKSLNWNVFWMASRPACACQPARPASTACAPRRGNDGSLMMDLLKKRPRAPCPRPSRHAARLLLDSVQVDFDAPVGGAALGGGVVGDGVAREIGRAHV